MPMAASARPAQVSVDGRSPQYKPYPIIVSCTTPKSTSAPTAAPMRRYANENGAAYAKSASGPSTPRPRRGVQLPACARTRSDNTTAPDASRIEVNDAASMCRAPNANLVKRELAANATSARSVSASVVKRRSMAAHAAAGRVCHCHDGDPPRELVAVHGCRQPSPVSPAQPTAPAFPARRGSAPAVTTRSPNVMTAA